MLRCTTYGNVVSSLENVGQPLCNVVTTLQKSCPTSSPMRDAVPRALYRPLGVGGAQVGKQHIYAGLILGLRPANERRRYFVTTSLIGWAQAIPEARVPHTPSQLMRGWSWCRVASVVRSLWRNCSVIEAERCCQPLIALQFIGIFDAVFMTWLSLPKFTFIFYFN